MKRKKIMSLNPKKAPAILNDETRCVVLIRDKPSCQWELIAKTMKKSVAWRSAFQTEKQEHLKNKKFEAVVMLEKDYEAGKLKSRLKAPPGFVFDPPTTRLVEAAKSLPETATTNEVAEKAGMTAEGALADEPFLSAAKKKKAPKEPKLPVCKKCGTVLGKLGYCLDRMCPYNDCSQTEEPKLPVCKKCGTVLGKLGYCLDRTCPYNDCSQTEEPKTETPVYKDFASHRVAMPAPAPVTPAPEPVKPAPVAPAPEPVKPTIDVASKFKAFLDD